MNDEPLRCFWPYFAPFVVHFHMVHGRAFACLSPYTHMFGAWVVIVSICMIGATYDMIVCA